MNNVVRLIVLAGFTLLASQQVWAQAVQVESTISGNQEQPKTIYVLPWQQPVGQIRIPASELAVTPPQVSPLDRQQFLRFIAVQASTVQTHSVNAEKQQ
ncbi:hypothetical protein [Rheinheimera sp.]|uniref:hypothetical protein n=1 Tax=Rheinheimera sp. TaxID=1869214 RepID=UPI004048B288